MKRLPWLLPILFVAVTSAAPSLPSEGATALTTFLKSATDRGDVPGVAVAVVDKNGVCCGIVSQADLARKAPRSTSAEVLSKVSEPNVFSSSVGGHPG